MLTAQNIKIAHDDGAWEVELKAEIPADAMVRYRDEAVKEVQKTAKMDGFRPGKVPLEKIVAVYGEPQLLRLAAERAIQKELPEILAKENILVIEAPRVQTEPPEAGKPLSFTARAPLPPEVTLPDWKKIAKEHGEKKQGVTVSDDEYLQAQNHIRRERARIENIEKGEEPGKAQEAARKLPEADLPPLDDEFAKTLGYESSAHFGEMLRSNIKSEKEMQEKQVRRNAILEGIVTAATIKYPAVMREYELDDMETRIREDLARMGMTFEQYLAQTKPARPDARLNDAVGQDPGHSGGKTRETLRKEWQEAADKRAKTRLILNEIARTEKITADEAAIEKEFAHAKEHYKETPAENLRAGIAHAMRNEKVLELLENQ